MQCCLFVASKQSIISYTRILFNYLQLRRSFRQSMLLFYMFYQGVRIEGVETPVSALGASCYSDSSLFILFFVLLTLKRTALCDLKNICPIMQHIVILRATTLRSWLSKLIFIVTNIETLANWLFVSKTESANKYTFTACKNMLYFGKK